MLTIMLCRQFTHAFVDDVTSQHHIRHHHKRRGSTLRGGGATHGRNKRSASSSPHGRRKRDLHGQGHSSSSSSRVIYSGGQANYLEVMVVADAEMERFHGDDLEHYIFVLMGLVRVK